uniref:Copine domain-containing protein n=1 Tax=Macrostomum lignano TaxID=282301 RepID=A0A1I8HKH3_9PLAT
GHVTTASGHKVYSRYLIHAKVGIRSLDGQRPRSASFANNLATLRILGHYAVGQSVGQERRPIVINVQHIDENLEIAVSLSIDGIFNDEHPGGWRDVEQAQLVAASNGIHKRHVVSFGVNFNNETARRCLFHNLDVVVVLAEHHGPVGLVAGLGRRAQIADGQTQAQVVTGKVYEQLSGAQLSGLRVQVEQAQIVACCGIRLRFVEFILQNDRVRQLTTPSRVQIECVNLQQRIARPSRRRRRRHGGQAAGERLEAEMIQAGRLSGANQAVLEVASRSRIRISCKHLQQLKIGAFGNGCIVHWLAEHWRIPVTHQSHRFGLQASTESGANSEIVNRLTGVAEPPDELQPAASLRHRQIVEQSDNRIGAVAAGDINLKQVDSCASVGLRQSRLLLLDQAIADSSSLPASLATTVNVIILEPTPVSNLSSLGEMLNSPVDLEIRTPDPDGCSEYRMVAFSSRSLSTAGRRVSRTCSSSEGGRQMFKLSAIAVTWNSGRTNLGGESFKSDTAISTSRSVLRGGAPRSARLTVSRNWSATSRSTANSVVVNRPRDILTCLRVDTKMSRSIAVGNGINYAGIVAQILVHSRYAAKQYSAGRSGLHQLQPVGDSAADKGLAKYRQPESWSITNSELRSGCPLSCARTRRSYTETDSRSSRSRDAVRRTPVFELIEKAFVSLTLYRTVPLEPASGSVAENRQISVPIGVSSGTVTSNTGDSSSGELSLTSNTRIITKRRQHGVQQRWPVEHVRRFASGGYFNLHVTDGGEQTLGGIDAKGVRDCRNEWAQLGDCQHLQIENASRRNCWNASNFGRDWNSKGASEISTAGSEVGRAQTQECDPGDMLRPWHEEVDEIIMVELPWLSSSETQQDWQLQSAKRHLKDNRTRSRSRSRRSRYESRRFQVPQAQVIAAGRKRRGDSPTATATSLEFSNSKAASRCVRLLPLRFSIEAAADSPLDSALIVRPLADPDHFKGICQQEATARFVNLDSANTLNSNATTRKFAAQMLAAHNEYRSLHQSPPLRFSEELTRQAQAWAELLAKRDSLAYDLKCDAAGIGENVARKCDIGHGEVTAQEFVDTWYAEVHNFNWRSLEDQFECSHFAQVVWRASREAGFGRAISMSGCVYIVGRYRPMGNNPGEFPRNVLPRVSRARASGNYRASRVSGIAADNRKGEAAAPLAPRSPKAEREPSSDREPAKRVPTPPAVKSSPSSAPEAPLSTATNEEPAPSTKSLFGALGAKSSAGPTASAPVSAMSLFGSLKSKAQGPANSEPASSKSLFGALSGKSDGGGAKGPLTANILHQTLGGSHTRQKRPSAEDLEEEAVPAFNMRKFVTQMLVSHNEYRAQHKAGPLRLNPQLNRLAQDWADVLAMRDKMAHDPNCSSNNTGENIAMKFRIGETNFPGDVFTDMWYEEIDSYDWNSNEMQPECGHFTQLVWKSTTEVGFGRAVSDTGRVYVVGRYRPPGNYKGEFRKNVLPSADDVVKAAGEEIVKEPMMMPSPISFAMRDFGAAKRRSVTFSTGAGGGGGSAAMRNLTDFVPQRSADGGGGKAASSPVAALLLRQTLQQSHVRAPEKKEETKSDEKIFSQKKFENQLLVSHNEFRALHRSPPLRLNPELSRLAQAWAEVLAGKDKMAHDPKCSSLGLGENVAMKFRKGFTNFPGDLFSELWYHEIDQYKWTGEDQLACGHFTQLVWRSSTEVGFGRAVSKSGRVYVVGRYRPPGNYSGQFGRNVLPPSRVMPKSRNNIINRSNLQADKKAAAAKAVNAANEAQADANVEYAGFGTARVVERRQGLTASNLRALPLASTVQQQQQQQ